MYGGYDWPKDLSRVVLDDVEARLWTDDYDLGLSADKLGWHVVVDEDPTGDPYLSPMLKAKYVKTHPLECAWNADVSIWVDGSMTITVPNFVELCLEALGDDDASFTPHPWRRCIWPEALETAQLRRYDDCDPLAQVNYYGSIGHPRNWGLFASGAFTVRHSDKVREWGQHWYHECTNRTYQDQLSMPVITRLMERDRGFKWNTNMPWAKWWGIANHLR